MTLNLPLLRVKRILIGDNHAAHQYPPDQRLALRRLTSSVRAMIILLPEGVHEFSRQELPGTDGHGERVPEGRLNTIRLVHQSSLRDSAISHLPLASDDDLSPGGRRIVRSIASESPKVGFPHNPRFIVIVIVLVLVLEILI